MKSNFTRLLCGWFKLSLTTQDIITASIVLSYTKFTLTSMRIISTSQLFDAAGNTRGYRIYLSGQYSWSGPDFIPLKYLVFAVIFLTLCSLLPILLCITGCYSVCHKCCSYSDSHCHCCCLSSNNWIVKFINSFQGCYKKKHRYFSGMYFFFRFTMLASLAFTQTIIQQYIVQQIAVTVMIALIALFKPYSVRVNNGLDKYNERYREYDVYNYADTLLFVNLSILNAAAIFMFETETTRFSYVIFGFECFLVFLPLVYIITYYVLIKFNT